MGISICFEDDFIIAVNKPNNVLVHHSFMARNMDQDFTLVQLLQEQLSIKLFPVHRLDRKTSGILLLAKQREKVNIFQELFKQNEIQKIYHALVRGFTPEYGIIDSPVKGRDANVHRDALTEYRKLREVSIDIPVQPYKLSRYSLVELKPKTGRLHQLRIHMNKMSHPIIGDSKYGDRFHNRMFEKKINCNRMFLHASSLEFRHPITQETVVINSEFPKHWAYIAKLFKWIDIKGLNFLMF